MFFNPERGPTAWTYRGFVVKRFPNPDFQWYVNLDPGKCFRVRYGPTQDSIKKTIRAFQKYGDDEYLNHCPKETTIHAWATYEPDDCRLSRLPDGKWGGR